MAKIAKILVTENKETFELYPVTSVKAVYDENDERLDSLLDKKVDIIHNGTFTVTKAYQAVFSVPFGTRAVFVVNQGGQSDLETLTLNAVSSTYSTLYTTNKDTLFYMDIWGVSGKCVVYMKNNGGVENSINLYYLSCAADKANWSPTGSYTDESNLAKAVTYWDTSISEKFATYTYTSSDSSLTINRSTTSANFMVNFAGDAFKNAIETNVNTVIGMTDTQVVNENLEPEAEVEVFGNTVPLGVVTKKSGTETVYTSAPEYKIYTHELPQNSDIYSHWYRMNLPMSGQMKVDITANINGGKVQGSIECCFRNGDWLMYASNATIAKYTRWTNTNGGMAMFIANYYYKTDYSLRVHRYDQTIRELSTYDFMPILATASEIEALQEMICLKEAAIDITKWIIISSDNYSATQAFVKSNPNYILAQSTKYSFTDALTDSFVMQFVTQVEGATISIYDKDGNLKTTSPQMSKTSENILNYNVTDDTFTWSEEAMSVAPVTVSLNEGTQYGSDVFGNVDVTVPGAIVNIVNKKLDTDKVCVSDEFGNIVVSTITVDELKSLSGVITNLQEQIDAIKEFQNGVNGSAYNYYCDGTITFDDSTTGTGYVFSNRGIFKIENATKLIIYNGYITNATAIYDTGLISVFLYDCDVKVETPTSFSTFFKDCTVLKEINLSGLDFTNINNLGSSFSNCRSLEKIEFHKPLFHQNADFWDFFNLCSSLKELSIEYAVMGVYENSFNYFCECCAGLGSVYLNSFSKESAELKTNLFSYSFTRGFDRCTNMTKFYCNNLGMGTIKKIKPDGANYYYMYNSNELAHMGSIDYMFCECYKLKNIEILNTPLGQGAISYTVDGVYFESSPFSTSMSHVFTGDTELEYVIIGEIPSDSLKENKKSVIRAAGQVLSFDYCFNECHALTDISLYFDGGIVLSSTNNLFKGLFQNCTALKNIYIYMYNIEYTEISSRQLISLSTTVLPEVSSFTLELGPFIRSGSLSQFRKVDLDLSCLSGWVNEASIYSFLKTLPVLITNPRGTTAKFSTLTISYATDISIKNSSSCTARKNVLYQGGWNFVVV